MSLPNQAWDACILQASKNADNLKRMSVVQQLGRILKTNVRACKALGHTYVVQLGHIFFDMLNVYKIMSENIAASRNSDNNQPLLRAMHVVKKETLTLLSEWISNSTANNVVIDNFVPPLLDAVLLGYQRCKVPLTQEVPTFEKRLKDFLTQVHIDGQPK